MSKIKLFHISFVHVDPALTCQNTMTRHTRHIRTLEYTFHDEYVSSYTLAVKGLNYKINIHISWPIGTHFM